MRRLLPVLLLLVSATAHAEWMEASSDHFVIYGKTGERNLRRFAEQLERFDAAMSVVTGTPRSKPSRSARVTVYMVGGEHELRALYAQDGRPSRYVAGFYSPRIEGPAAFVPDVIAARGEQLELSMVVLLHEYAHHFNAVNSGFPPPRWLSEGSAEFFASARFDAYGAVQIGRAADHRGPELFEGLDVTATDLLDPEHYQKRRGDGKRYDAYYGRAWLLFHYLTFEPSRKGQLAAYVKALASGKPLREAAESVFGDLVKLDKEMDTYLRRRSFMALTIKGESLPIGDIAVRPLRPGEAAAMPVVIRSKRGVGSETTAAKILADARAVASRFPDDPAVLAALAEAEHDAGNDDAAVVAADAALALEPGNVNAHIQKGYSLFRKAERSRDETAMRAARRAFVALNRIENDHPVPLVYFYRSFGALGVPPTANAVQGLEQAAGLAPYAHEIRMNLAYRYLAEGKLKEARTTLLPVAYNPHGGKTAERLRAVVEQLGQAQPGDASALADALAAADGSSDDGSDEDGGGEGGKPSP